jgi:hypothetical protein
MRRRVFTTPVYILVLGFLALLRLPAQTTFSISRTASTQTPTPFPVADRICCTNSDWEKIETSRGTYVWTGFDASVSTESGHAGAFPIYTDRYVPTWASGGTHAAPPSDLASSAACQGVLTGTTTTNCQYKEFVTALMRHVCGVSAQPGSPLVGVCTVKVFESWNEMNVGNYWTGNVSQMAHMAEDKAAIIRLYCGDCTILGGSTSAGGDGTGGSWINGSMGLEPFLAAWGALTSPHLPDAVSWHAYPARTTIVPAPMPETLLAYESGTCTGTANTSCRTAIKDQVAELYSTDILSNAAITSWAANLPVWETEGGYGPNVAMTDGVSDTSANTWFLRGAYIARWMAVLAATPSSGSAPVHVLNYSSHDQCWGTHFGTNIANGSCASDSLIPVGATLTNTAFVQMRSWLAASSTIGVLNSTAVSGGTVWTINTTTNGSPAQLAWFDGRLATTSYATAYQQQQSLAGTTSAVTGGTVSLTNQPMLLTTNLYLLSTSASGTGSISGCGGNYLSGATFSCTLTGTLIGTPTGCGGTLTGTTYSGTMPSGPCLVGVSFATNSNFLTITTINANEISDGVDGIKGKFCAYATDATDNPIAFSVGGIYQAVKATRCVNVTAGQFVGTLKLANPAVTTPLNIRYHVTIADTVHGTITQYPGVSIVAPNPTWDWSSWNPATGVSSIPVNVITGPTGPTGPAGPAGPGTIAGLSSNGTNGINVAGAVAATAVLPGTAIVKDNSANVTGFTPAYPSSNVTNQYWNSCWFNMFASDPVCGTSDGTMGPFTRLLVNNPTRPGTANDTYQAGQFHLDAVSGGMNQNPSPFLQKSNWLTLGITQLSYTPGQHFSLSTKLYNGSDGDSFAAEFIDYQWGNSNAAGDEGVKGIGVYAQQGWSEFGATISGITGNTLSYTGASSDEYSRGEGRLLLNTTTGVYATGTITAIAGTPPVVTGSGTLWTTLGSGTVSNLCFELDSGNAVNSLLYVIRVASIGSDTSLTLDYAYLGGQSAWVGDATTGTYKIYKCSTVTAVAKTGAVTVADATQFSIGNSIKMPVGNALLLCGICVQISHTLPGGGGTTGIAIQNQLHSPRTADQAMLTSGNFKYLIQSNGGTLAKTFYQDQGPVYSLVQLTGQAAGSSLGILSLNTDLGGYTESYSNSGGTRGFFGASKWEFDGIDNSHGRMQMGSVPLWYADQSTTTFTINKGALLQFLSGNQSGQTASINASTGAAVFSGGMTGNVTGNVTGAVTGNASTATALASAPTKCSAGNYPLGVDVSGNAQNCTAVPGGSVTPVQEGMAYSQTYTGQNSTFAYVMPSVKIPANTLGAHGSVDVCFYGIETLASGSIHWRVFFGGQWSSQTSPAGSNVFDLTVSTGSNVRGCVTIYNKGATNAQGSDPDFSTAGNVFNSPTGTPTAIDTTADQWVTVGVLLPNASDSATLNSGFVRVWPQS